VTGSAISRLNRLVVVTGASSGIGRACALRLRASGFMVFAGVRRESDADSLREEAGETIEPLLVDVRDRQSLAKAAERVGATLETLPDGSWELGLVNNAGETFTGPLEFLPLDDLRSQLEVNVVGQLSSTQAFLPLMRRSRGRIVFVGSMFGRFAAPFIGPYCASKFSLEGLADALRMELGPWRIPVSVVEPGVVDTPIWEKYESYTGRLFARLPDEARLLYERRVVAAQRTATRSGERGMDPEKVAEVVACCLTSSAPKARYPVGYEARLAMMASRLLPARIFDRLTLARIGMRSGSNNC
jgi:NAD(P)-dependent dehydrogenase (short-subunit alcohol dehydrogenase family)